MYDPEHVKFIYGGYGCNERVVRGTYAISCQRIFDPGEQSLQEVKEIIRDRIAEAIYGEIQEELSEYRDYLFHTLPHLRLSVYDLDDILTPLDDIIKKVQPSSIDD